MTAKKPKKKVAQKQPETIIQKEVVFMDRDIPDECSLHCDSCCPFSVERERHFADIFLAVFLTSLVCTAFLTLLATVSCAPRGYYYYPDHHHSHHQSHHYHRYR